MVPISEKDMLAQDPSIRGQSFACVSFLSPDEILKKKEAFYFENYVKDFSRRANELIEGLEENYPDKKDNIRSIKEAYQDIFKPDKIDEEFRNFVSNDQKRSKDEDQDSLEKTFNEKHDFQTNVQGIKIRGVYESVQEAQLRCEHLRKMDNDKFSIYICEVGCWCPWSPNPDLVSDQKFAVDSLNTLMNEYEKNAKTKDEYYSTRKAELKSRIEENEENKKLGMASIDDEESVSVEEIKGALEKEPEKEPEKEIPLP